MTTTAQPTSRPTGAVPGVAFLDRAVDAMAAKRAAEVTLLVAAVEWAEANPAHPDGAAGWGEPSDLFGEGFLPLAGDGTPLVAEFAPVELGAALGWTAVGAQLLMGDGLELKYRLPRLWGLVCSGRVPVHLAREVAQHTRHLSGAAVARVDRLVCADPAHLSRVRIEPLVRQARLWEEPEQVVAEEDSARAARRVDLHPGRCPATTEVVMVLDTPDARAFDTAVAQAAQALQQCGDPDGLDVRRARAVGVLADPQRALDLLTTATDPRGTRAGSLVKPAATLWLRVDAAGLAELDTFPAAVGIDALGTASTDLVKTWLPEATVVVKPVLDLRRHDAVDVHDPPQWMADLVRFRDRHCVFPGCRRESRVCDLDHIVAYVPIDEGGPPGQTFPDGLAPLCRRHHRAKTHTRWRYRRRPDGTYTWTSPAGRTNTVPPATSIFSPEPD